MTGIAKDQYQPQREATKKEAARVTGFAKLINQASDVDTEKQVGSPISMSTPSSRFMAANVLTIRNLESFLALGNNYSLHLDSKTDKFTLIPGDLEFSFANFLLMGSGGTTDGPESQKSRIPARTSCPTALLAIAKTST